MYQLEPFMAELEKRNPAQPEFIQAVREVIESVIDFVNANPAYEANNILERITEPDRVITFRVDWEDDEGHIHTNRGYRVQFNNAIGPYKGGLRFHRSVTLGTLKFLGFEQTFKNSLTTLPMGGGKGGSDFDPRGRSNAEIMRFCRSFMTELQKYIGPDQDVPAGDIGVAGREIGFLYGQYKRLRNENAAVLTGKGLSIGGSLVRPEATGFGAVYYLQAVMDHQKDTLQGKTVAVAGFGNVAWGAIRKLSELGAIVKYMSGPDGYVYDPDGINTEKKFQILLDMRASGRNKVEDYVKKVKTAKFIKGKKPWGEKVDIIMPCATQNDVTMEWAKKIAANKVPYYIEVANMPTTNDALAFLMKQKGMVVAPSKAVNAGGVLVSGLEMSQNSERLSWTAEEVDTKLHDTMRLIHDGSAAAAERYGLGYNLVAGANIVSFQKIADAMMAQGVF